MSCWAISEGCIVDEESMKQGIIKNGEFIKLPKRSWIFLIELLKAKKDAIGTGEKGILPYNIAYRRIWGDKIISVNVVDGLKKARQELVNVIGKDAVGNESSIGYYLKYDIYEVQDKYDVYKIDTINMNTDEYYKALWESHYKGILRDQVATGSVRELIDYFVIPSIVNEGGLRIDTPFSGVSHYIYLCAGSGYGKSTLLDMVLLTNIAKHLFNSKPDSISQNSKEKISKYDNIRLSLFGSKSQYFFPVFIHSDKANNSTYDSILDIAEANNLDNFQSLLKAAERRGNLLFLIDSIDEVDGEKQTKYLNSIEKLFNSYPNAHAIFASRFLGNKHFPFAYDSIYLSELPIDSIIQITHAMLSEAEADKLLEKINNNQYLITLAKNPFMLMIILETKGERLVHSILESIVNAIIDRRWFKQHYDISSEEIKLLLGYLACNFVFDNRRSVDISEIQRMLFDAREKLELFSEDFSSSSQSIERFVRTISSQSGILTIQNEHHVERYVFQDSLIKCWLAANYLDKSLANSKEIAFRNGMAGIWSNALWIDKFIRSFSQREILLSKEAVIVLVLIIVMNSGKSGPDLQKSILYYMIFKYSTSLNKEEREHILSGFHDIVNNTFGNNDITNHQDNSDSYRLISQLKAL